VEGVPFLLLGVITEERFDFEERDKNWGCGLTMQLRKQLRVLEAFVFRYPPPIS
jgi:hypothetical protein